MIDTGHHRLSIGTISVASANDRYRPAPSVPLVRRTAGYGASRPLPRGRGDGPLSDHRAGDGINLDLSTTGWYRPGIRNTVMTGEMLGCQKIIAARAAPAHRNTSPGRRCASAPVHITRSAVCQCIGTHHPVGAGLPTCQYMCLDIHTYSSVADLIFSL